MCSAVLGLMTLSSHAIAQQKTAKDMPGRVESQQGCQSGQRRHRKGLRSSMPRRRCTRSDHCGPSTTAGSCSCSDSRGYGTKDSKGMPGRVESQQGCQSSQRRHGKGLRSSMPRRRCTRSNHCGPGTTAGSCSCSDSRDYGTKDCKGMPGRVESQQGCQSGQRRHRKGLRSSMPRRRCTRSNHCGPAPPPRLLPLLPLPAAPAAPAPAPTAAAPPSRPAPPPPPTAGPAPSVPANPVGANEFSTEAQAKARCPTDTVVWVTLTSKIYHFSGTRYYGNTKHGAYMCERDAAAAGMRAAKNETHP